jgi:hypothetical protein
MASSSEKVEAGTRRKTNTVRNGGTKTTAYLDARLQNEENQLH